MKDQSLFRSATTVPAAWARNRLLPHMALAALLAAGGAGLAFVPWSSPAEAQLKGEAATAPVPVPGAPVTFADIVERVKPAVVSVSVSGDNKARVAKAPQPGAPQQQIPRLPNLPEDHPLNEFFRNMPKEFPGAPPQEESRPAMGQGSGFVISADGFVVTNNHVIDGASKIQVSFDDQEKLEADLVGADPRTDLALLKIKSTKTFPFVKFAAKASRVGDWVLAVGNPFGLGGTVTAGILSAQARDIGSGPYDYLQVDAAVNRGNSGGPTFNLAGEVIGVNTAIYSPSGGNVGIAFAVPSETAMDVIESLKRDGTVSRGWLGVKIQDVDEDVASSIGLAKAKGALISEIMPNGPSAGTEMKVRDAIIEVNGQPISDSRDLARKIAEFEPNKEIDVKVWRNNADKVFKIKLGRFPGSQDELASAGGAKPSSTELGQLGLKLAPAADASAGGGVAIAEVDPESDAALKGLKAGDVILDIGGKSVSSPGDIVDGVKQANELGRKAVLLSVKSADQQRIVAVQLRKG